MTITPPRFNSDKTCVVAAYLVQLAGGKLDMYTLIKLLYIMDREAYKRWCHAVTFDSYVSMPFGPVVSKTYDILKGEIEDPLWTEYFHERKNNTIFLKTENPDFGLMSRAEEELAQELYEIYGKMDFDSLCEITHKFAEYEDPKGSSLPITINSILNAVTDDEEQIKSAVEELHTQVCHERIFG